MYLTILFVSRKEDPDLYKRVVDVCNYCLERDKEFSFGERENGEGIVIRSLSKTQAYKRGSYFHKKFPEVYYQVVYEK